MNAVLNGIPGSIPRRHAADGGLGCVRHPSDRAGRALTRVRPVTAKACSCRHPGPEPRPVRQRPCDFAGAGA
jgi:hypothetical protein